MQLLVVLLVLLVVLVVLVVLGPSSATVAATELGYEFGQGAYDSDDVGAVGTAQGDDADGGGENDADNEDDGREQKRCVVDGHGCPFVGRKKVRLSPTAGRLGAQCGAGGLAAQGRFLTPWWGSPRGGQH